MKNAQPTHAQKMTLSSQHIFALALLNFHGGQSSGLYAVGSCMLSDCGKHIMYAPELHHGHCDNDDEQGALSRAIWELKGFGKGCAFPASVDAADKRKAYSLARKLEGAFPTH
jgi:hypothetical protein